jgi:DNA-3-methyladenine glycosylase
MPRLIKPRRDSCQLWDATALEQELKPEFFARPALTVARELIGQALVFESATGARTTWLITETEAYIGAQDLACHGRFGPTSRTAVMFGPAGYWYLYLIYGMYWMLNVVTDQPDVPAAVLIRGAGPCDGPGKLTKQLGIDRQWNGTAIHSASRLWIARTTINVPRRELQRTPRIGVDYAGAWKDRPYRFVWVKSG